MTIKKTIDLPYSLDALPRETRPFYIGASANEQEKMLEALNVKSLAHLYHHIDRGIMKEELHLPEVLGYEETAQKLLEISRKNNIMTSFLADAMPVAKEESLAQEIMGIRGLTTAYTPYQPERSQGTLISLWIYQCLMAELTEFEAINASLYDRATALYEAITCAVRISRDKNKVLLSRGLFPQDIEVVETQLMETGIEAVYVDLDEKTGLTDLKQLEALFKEHSGSIAALAFAQVNQLGLLEDVHALTDFAQDHGLLAIASIDPAQLGSGGLTPPSAFGKKGADIIIGEGQHLAIGRNFGGPGLGIFGVRYNDQVKNHIRSTPGRFVGKAKDIEGNEALALILSTREQHIRKEKATSNICSNQSFLATLVGACLLSRGNSGMEALATRGREHCKAFLKEIQRLKGVTLVYPETATWNECLVETTIPAKELIARGREERLHIGVDMTGRIKGKQSVKIAFSDEHTQEDVAKLVGFFKRNFTELSETKKSGGEVKQELLRKEPMNFPEYSDAEILEYYKKLGELNMSPDLGPYPLGSCTMKYNPYINDWAATLGGFTQIHPQAPEADAQGCLEILYEIQEWFKGITGLAGVTTQPVAGAQGELVGLKLFQAYHRDRGEEARDIIFIPKSAHGTNFATAASAGFDASKIITISANSEGEIDFKDFEEKLAQYGQRLCGIMITNPNTSGIFERRFGEIAGKIHDAGGLVYMDGANLNAIAGWVDLNKLGVDAVHSNLHKTWSIPHGGGGPGDGIVAVSERLVEFLPGKQIIRTEAGTFQAIRAKKCIGSFHRHWGNFAHKVRCYTYLLRLGREGIKAMTANAVLSARYLFKKAAEAYPMLPVNTLEVPRMHEFIITLSEELFASLEKAGVARTQAAPRVGKLFLDFGIHAPTVAFPEPLGLMIEPTESFTLAELDRFLEAIHAIKTLILEHPELVAAAPQTTPVKRLDEVEANRTPVTSEKLEGLPRLPTNFTSLDTLHKSSIEDIKKSLLTKNLSISF